MGMDPVTISLIAMAVAGVGTGVSAYGQYQQGKSQEKLANYNAQVQEANAANKARDGRAMANAQRRKNEQLKARQRTLSAKSGVTGAGSPLAVAAQQAGEMEMQALDIERNAANAALADRQQATLDRAGGKAAKRGALWAAGGTILSGVGSSVSSFSSMKQLKTSSSAGSIGSATSSPLSSMK